MDFIKYWFNVLGVGVAAIAVAVGFIAGLKWLSDGQHYVWITIIVVLVVVTLVALITYEDLG